MRRTSVRFLVLASALLAAGSLQAQQKAASAERPAAAALGSITAIATVEAIDLAKREVTLRKDDGEVVVLVVGPEARNLPQLRVGDTVKAQYDVGFVVALGPPGTETRVEETELVRTLPGERPGGIVRNTVAVSATVVEIDAERRIVTLRGPERTVGLQVADDIDLSRVAVGDRVGAVYEESLAILVEPVEE